EGERMWIEPSGFSETHSRGNTEAHRLQDPSKWVPFGVGAIEGQASRPLRVLEGGDGSALPAPAEVPGPAGAASTPGAASQTGAPTGEFGPGEEPRPRDGEPTGSAHGELL
ncbi:MAG TPA: hypothetical protein VID95_06250, partial [Candidatus Limnocylindrales bacterium]